MAEFVHFVIEDVHEQGKLDETRRVFQLLEKVLVEGDQETKRPSRAPHTKLEYSRSEALGFSSLLCFCRGYLWLIFAITR